MIFFLDYKLLIEYFVPFLTHPSHNFTYFARPHGLIREKRNLMHITRTEEVYKLYIYIFFFFLRSVFSFFSNLRINANHMNDSNLKQQGILQHPTSTIPPYIYSEHSLAFLQSLSCCGILLARIS